jgi:hypothetical protein
MIRKLTATVLLSVVVVGESSAAEQSPPFRVYWDVSHGVVDEHQPSGRYGVLVDHLAPFGFQFTEGSVGLEAARLSAYDVLVFAAGSFADTFPTAAELSAVQSFLQGGGGLLVLSEIAGSSGTPKIQQITNLFGAQVGLSTFPTFDVFSTSVGVHPSVSGVRQIYIRFSSTISPGALTPYAFYEEMPMLAAGHFDGGRIVLIADGDLFTFAPFGPHYFDLADNRQLAESVFRYLAIPEASSLHLGVAGTAMLLRRRRRVEWTE